MKLERTEQIKCTHVKSTAHWLSSKKIKELKQLYKASPEDAIREFGGVVVSDYKPALRKEEVEACFSRPRVRTAHRPQYLFTACDPNGGGPSQMSIVSAYFDGLARLVVRTPFLFPILENFTSFLNFCSFYFRSLNFKVLENFTNSRVHVMGLCAIDKIPHD